VTREQRPAVPPAPQRSRRFESGALADFAFQLLLAVIALVIACSVVAIAVGHASDRYQLDDGTSGIWLALGREAEHGVIFPPLFDGKFYGGTRYMPLPILSVAAADQLVGGLVLAAKLAAYLFAAALFALAFWILYRRQRCSPAAAAFLVCGVLMTLTVTNSGLLAATGVRFDSLATFLQLLALALVERSRATRTLILAALVCVLAILSKLSALWAPIAIMIWLAARTPGKLRVFVPVFLSSLAAALLAVEVASGNRFFSQIRTLSFAGYQGSIGEGNAASSVQNGLSRLAHYCWLDARPMVLLLPFALLALCLSWRRRAITIYQVALLCIVPLLVVTFRDQGVAANHLIEPAALTAVVVGGLWGSGIESDRRVALLRLAIAAAVIATVTGLFRSHVYPEARRAVNELRGFGQPYPLQPLHDYVGPGERLLSEDTYIPVSIGERPVILDLFMYRRFAKTRPAWQAALAHRVSRSAFEKIVLTLPVEVGFDTGHFGGIVNGAIEKAYYLSGYSGVYWIYRPYASASFCKPNVSGDVVRFCGPATAQLSAFPGLTFRNGSCALTVTNGAAVLTLSLGARYARPITPDRNRGLTSFTLTLIGSSSHPTGGGVIAYARARKWIGGGLRFTKGGADAARFAVQGFNSNPTQATGSFSCGKAAKRWEEPAVPGG
jgi:hypothetical protein